MGLQGALPAGCTQHIAGPSPEGWRVLAVWDSPEALHSFMAERLRPTLTDLGVAPPPAPPVIYPLRADRLSPLFRQIVAHRWPPQTETTLRSPTDPPGAPTMSTQPTAVLARPARTVVPPEPMHQHGTACHWDVDDCRWQCVAYPLARYALEHCTALARPDPPT